ncbi:MAG: hypothetical protein IH846_10595 [Acidobacteria bacterium]|nr:hypothetical protein [Acidobacteriota bacterium]
MPVLPYHTQLEPRGDAVIWRFLDMDKFRDLMANQEMYFRRADLFKKDDPNEGLPTDDYVRNVRGLVKFDLHDELTLNNDQAFARQNSEGYYLSCWSLYKGNALRMWFTYAQNGVAVCSRHELLKATLNGMLDEIHLGQVRYDNEEMTGYNTLQCIYTKGRGFSWENEIRAVLCSNDPVAGLNRHYDQENFPHREPLDELNPLHKWVHDHKRRHIDLKSLVTSIYVSPWATDEMFKEVEHWAKVRNYDIPVAYDQKNALTPTPEEMTQRGWTT